MLLAVLGGLVTATRAEESVISLPDGTGDWLIRRTDPGRTLPLDPVAHRPADVIEIILGRWTPAAPRTDLFTGAYALDGLFVRIDVRLCGLHNPPGRTDPPYFDPFAYGPHPVFAFIEVDLDRDVETGGELDYPEYRYVGNAVRFGGMPAVPALLNRFARRAADFDGNIETPPYVDRSGEEFHLALMGRELDGIQEVSGDGDLLFESGEVWWLTGRWFHRAHGYERFSFAQGGTVSGAYDPRCTLEFAHEPVADTTRIALVFPLTNQGAALMWGQTVQAPNANCSDQFSVHEALMDLHMSAMYWERFPSGDPAQVLINGWRRHGNPGMFLLPTRWDVQALLGSSYTAAHAQDELFAWTDVYPNARRGDVNGDDAADRLDQLLIQNYIVLHDLDDGVPDGRVVLPNVAVNFDLFDVNHSGVIDELDVLLVGPPGDLDGDGDVDLLDCAALQGCASGAGAPHAPGACGLADIDMDGDVDGEDFVRFAGVWAGPEP